MTPIVAIAERSLLERSIDELLIEAVRFHGHMCPGQVLGVRMTVAGCRETGLDRPRSAGKGLVVLVEIDRCATDATQVLTGASLDERTLRHLEYGKMAATFVNVVTGAAVRVSARDDARALAADWAPGETDPRKAQIGAYQVMPEPDLLRIEPVMVEPGWLGRRRGQVFCDACGEGVDCQREVVTDGRTLCRPCTGERYYSPLAADRGSV